MAAGTKTAGHLIEKGFWVNGICDYSAQSELNQLKESEFLKVIGPKTGWCLVTIAPKAPLLLFFRSISAALMGLTTPRS